MTAPPPASILRGRIWLRLQSVPIGDQTYAAIARVVDGLDIETLKVLAELSGADIVAVVQPC